MNIFPYLTLMAAKCLTLLLKIAIIEKTQINSIKDEHKSIMLLEEREQIILSNINSNGMATVRQLAKACDVTEVTVRRDLKRLEEHNLLKRVFGGAVSIERSQYATQPFITPHVLKPSLPNADALIITTIDTRDAHTLRERAIRQNIPLVAEGNPQEGAVYLGIDKLCHWLPPGQMEWRSLPQFPGAESHTCSTSVTSPCPAQDYGAKDSWTACPLQSAKMSARYR